MSKTRKRGRKKKKGYSIEILGIIIIFISVLAIGEFGFVGEFFANVIRVFVGDTYQLLAVFASLLGLHYLFRGKGPKFKKQRLIGSIFLFVALLVWLHQRVFAPIMEADVNIVYATWRNLLNLFSRTTTTQDIGGGMIGAFLYAISYFLFANIGTYIFISLLAFFGIMSIGQFSYKNLFSKIGDGIKMIFHSLPFSITT